MPKPKYELRNGQLKTQYCNTRKPITRGRFKMNKPKFTCKNCKQFHICYTDEIYPNDPECTRNNWKQDGTT